MAAGSSKKVIYAALAGNFLIAITKFGAALWTGSSAMLSEGVHSLVDTGNQALLLYGHHRADRPPNERHPLGFGRELYFWSFIVALLLFSLGAGISFYEGIQQIREPHPITDPMVNYVVIAFSVVFEGASWSIALLEFRKTKGELGYFEAFKRSKNPPLFVVLFEDTAALIGLAIAALGNLASHHLNNPVLDGVASLGISLVLAVTAVMLARESKELLIGEPAAPGVMNSIMQIARQQDGVQRVNGLMTVHLAPDEIVLAMSVEFADPLHTPQIERRIASLEAKLRAAHPEIISVFIKPQAPEQFRQFSHEGPVPQVSRAAP
jgi:cation diffusion facilitator family transporter